MTKSEAYVSSKFPPFPNYLSEADVSAMRKRIQEFAVMARENKIGLLFGSGFSHDAVGLPLGWQLAVDFVKEGTGCNDDVVARAIADKYGLAACAQQYGEDGIEQKVGVIRFINAKFEQTTKKHSIVQKDLDAIVSQCFLSHIFTTNFDNVIEESMDASKIIVVEPTRDAVIKFDEERENRIVTGIFHLMGDMKKPIVTEDDLNEKPSVLFERFRNQFLIKHFAFVGYSFSDEAIETIYRQIQEVLKETNETKLTLIVMPIDNDYEYKFANRLWNCRLKMLLIPLHASDFLAELRRAVDEVREQGAIEKIAKNLDIQPEEVKKRLRKFPLNFQALSSADVAELIELLSQVR